MSEQLELSAMDEWLNAHVELAAKYGTQRSYSPTEYRSAAVPCNQRNCKWMLDIEWRDTADSLHLATLGTWKTDVLLRHHFEREHGIPVIPEGMFRP